MTTNPVRFDEVGETLWKIYKDSWEEAEKELNSPFMKHLTKQAQDSVARRKEIWSKYGG